MFFFVLRLLEHLQVLDSLNNRDSTLNRTEFPATHIHEVRDPRHLCHVFVPIFGPFISYLYSFGTLFGLIHSHRCVSWFTCIIE